MPLPTVRLRGRAVPAWVVAVVLVQVALPTVLLFADPVPTRLGFHMYSARGGVSVTAHDHAGREVEGVRDELPPTRQDLPWVDFLPEYVCERFGEVARVHVAQSGRERTLECP